MKASKIASCDSVPWSLSATSFRAFSVSDIRCSLCMQRHFEWRIVANECGDNDGNDVLKDLFR